MGGTVSGEASVQAIQTVARLQQAAQRGMPVLIPGAREGAAPASREVIDVIADPAAAYARSLGVFNRIRFAHEPDRAPDRTFLARLWRRVYRGPE